jgi:NAD(P)-dependent dehydrogenase (short-subunit alcohol dehydrogenase family)
VQLEGKVAVVTGAASGIGKALCAALAGAGISGLVAADLDIDGCQTVATASGLGERALALHADVAREADVAELISRTEAALGPVDLYFSNAGIAIPGGVEVADREWERIWAVNVMAHVYAARVLVPRMTGRGSGAIVVTASAAGLLTNLGSAPYSVTKHAAVALAEWLAITHGDEGLEMYCLCPQGVRTPLLEGGLASGDAAARAVLLGGALLDPATVAAATLTAMVEGRFLVLPHPEVATYTRWRAEDPTRWLRGMRRAWAGLQDPMGPDGGSA